MHHKNQILTRMKAEETHCDFHVHAWTSRICVYVFETFQSDFKDFYVNKKKTLKKKIFFSVFFISDMLEFRKNLSKHAIGMLNAGMTMNAVAMNIGFSTYAIQQLKQRFQYLCCLTP